MAINRNIRSIGYVTIGLLLGKLTGFFKHFLIIKYFGLTYKSDVFFIANTITEMSINIVLAGLLTGAFIPVASEVFVKFDRNKFSEFVSSAFTIIGGVLLLISILLYAFSYQLGQLMAPGYKVEQYLMLSKIFKLLSPGILFIGLAAILKGIMHTLENFLIPAFGLFIANGTVIFSTIILHNTMGIFAPVLGISLGFFLWFLMQIPFTIKYLRFKRVLKISDIYLKKFFKLCIPAIGVIFFTNIILIVEKAVASTFAEGSITQLNLAFRISLVFSSILVIPLATIVLPKMSKNFGKKDLHRLYQLSSKSLKIISIMMFLYLSLIILNNYLIIGFVLKILDIPPNTLNSISNYLVFYSFAVATLFLYIITQKIFYATQKIYKLLFANFLGVISYALTILLLKSILNTYVLPIAYFIYALTVVCYLFSIINTKILAGYPFLLNKKIFLGGFIIVLISLILKLYIAPNNFILLLFSIIIVLFFLIMFRNELLKIKNT
ncbi:MAG: hypothetical protein ISS28_05025 [Candidatus Cloacimonetes bacterium]|nr:hypothetical protein [Candidatus Cloacimonadota bacterium]